jgi:hypothetical protein
VNLRCDSPEHRHLYKASAKEIRKLRIGAACGSQESVRVDAVNL